ncbi:MAG: choice-of-anchor tandem repeat GloVer-containing protein, partial [Candidatus Cybelea sp.]
GGGDDGSYPVSGLIDVNGTLYGTTNDGGSGSFGTVYSVGTTGSEKVLHSFSGSGDGAGPAAGLIDVKGTLYGTTEGGGTAECDCGTVFSITIAGVEMVLHSFAGSTGDGERPTSGLIDVNGTLYGTTSGGGKYGSQPGCGGGCGTVYAITTTGKESLVYDFTGSEVNDDGSAPRADLVDMDGALYGTTSEGGEACHDTLCACHFVGGCGTVFSVTTTGAETVLHRFTGGTDGALPIAGLLDVNGTLYGTTEHASSYHRHGGPRGPGTVFALTP